MSETTTINGFTATQRASMLARAAEILGTPWRAGGRSTSEGMDCLGVLMDIYSAAGIKLPEVAGETRAGILESLFRRIGGLPAFGDVARWSNSDGRSHVAVVLCKEAGGKQLVQGCSKLGVHALPIRDALRNSGMPEVAYWRWNGGAE